MNLNLRLKILTQVMLTLMSTLFLVSVTHYFSSSYNRQSAYAFSPDMSGGGSVNAREFAASLKAQPDSLLDLTGGAVLKLFSKPDMIRREAQVSVFQYRTDICVLDLYFNVGPDQFLKASVQHYEVRPRDHNAPPEDAALAPCVHDLLKKMHRPGVLGISWFN